MTYIVPPLETDPATLAQEALDYLEENIPGFSATPASIEGWLLEANARLAAEIRDLAADVTTEIFRYYGTLVGVRPIEATAASAVSTWTVVDDAGYTIPAGTLVGIPATGDELYSFVVQDDVVIPPGETATGAGEVLLVAEEAGAAASGLSGVPQLVDALAYVQAIALVSDTAGGDAEDDDHYLGRLRDELTLQSPRPILPRDFAVLARRIGGVERVLALDLYDPGPPEDTAAEGVISLALVDAEGQAVPAPVKTAVANLFAERRLLNVEVNLIDPTYTEVDVSFTAVAFPGFDPADVETRAIAAVEAYLSPSTWGSPPFGDPSSGGGWIPDTLVRYSELYEVLNRVEGLNYVETLELAAAGDPQSEQNVALAGVAALPEAGAIAGAVTAP
jgi:hypothetical protein